MIGGGPAGATAAAALARGGVRVTLLDMGHHPRGKVCGECLSPLGVRTLRRLGLAGRLRGVRLTSTAVYPTRGRPARVRLGQASLGVARDAMDAALLAAAASLGVEVVQGRRATRVVPGERPRVETTDGEWECDRVVLADGKGTLPGAAADPPPRPTGDLGVKCHLVGVEALSPNEIALFGARGYYGGLAPVLCGNGSRRWNLAFSVPNGRVKAWGGDLGCLLGEVAEANPHFRRATRGASVAGDWLACPLPRFGPRAASGWPMNVIPVGNAAAAIEPVGGEGMGLAVASADLATRAMLDDWPAEALAAAYGKLWRRRRATCRALALLVGRPSLAVPAAFAARRLPGVAQVGAAAVGKGGVPRVLPRVT